MPPAATTTTKIVAPTFSRSEKSRGFTTPYAPAISPTTPAVIVHCCRFANLSSSKYAALIVGSVIIVVTVHPGETTGAISEAGFVQCHGCRRQTVSSNDWQTTQPCNYRLDRHETLSEVAAVV